jgi:membrane-associated protein
MLILKCYNIKMSINIEEIIKSVGLLGVLLIVFIESGLLIGFFLPGDSLLFTAGILSSAGYFSFFWLLIGGIAMAILGDQTGYYLGKRWGRKIFERNSKFFKKEHLVKAEKFYQNHGPSAIILARFIPVVRVFVPTIAGVAHMDKKTFSIFNAIGGTLWVSLMVTLGKVLGDRVENIEAYILPIAGIIIILSFLPILKNKLSKSKKQK